MKNLASRKLAAVFFAVILLAVAMTPAAAGEGAFDVQFSGVIDSVPANPGDTWQIAGHVVAVDDATQVILTTGAVAPGMWASVQARREADDSLLASRIAVQPAEMRLKGPVQVKPADNLGAWTIAGQPFLVDEETRINLRAGPIAVDTWVEVTAVEEAGVLRALRIHAVEACEDVEVYGAIQGFGPPAWEISGVPVAANTDSLVVGEPEVGLLVHVLATLQEDDSLLGKTFKVTWVEPERLYLRQPVRLRGIVEALPADGLIGAWTVAGRTVQVTDATRIFQVKAIVTVGAEVHIVGWEENGEIIAVEITVLNGSYNGGRRFQWRGTVVALPPGGGPYGKWIIEVNGEQMQVQVVLRTRIMNGEQARVGAPVELGGVQARNGTCVATWLRIRG
jgi:hypothetical protein